MEERAEWTGKNSEWAAQHPEWKGKNFEWMGKSTEWARKNSEWMGKSTEWTGQHYESGPGQVGTDMVSFIKPVRAPCQP